MTPTQVGLRAGVAGTGNAAFSFLGGVTGGAALGWLCGPGVIICAPVGAIFGAIGGGIFWSEVVQPVIFEAPFLRPADRNILPLN